MDSDRSCHEEHRRRFPNDRYPDQSLTKSIIACSFTVFREFGYGFLESVYRRALGVELDYRGITVREEVPYELFHRGVSVGLYRADLVAGGRVIVETKTSVVLDPVARPQLLNCLCAARLSVGLVLHFGPGGVQAKRVIMSNRARLPAT
jgi:GxxExxY protein